MELKTNKYFLLTDMGYDGILVTTYDKLKDAVKEYEENKISPYYDGVALIEGIVINEDKFRWH